MVLDLPVGHPNFGQLVRCPTCNEGNLPERLKAMSGLSDEMREWTLSGLRWHEERAAAIDGTTAFVRELIGWLTVWGEFGVGKTYLLASIVNQCIQRRVAASYHVLPELLRQLKAGYENGSTDRLIDNLKSASILALDEVDKARGTSWELATVFEILDWRYRNANQVGTVLAMNTDPRGDTTHPLAYVFSRAHDARFAVVQMGGGDVRPLVGEM